MTIEPLNGKEKHMNDDIFEKIGTTHLVTYATCRVLREILQPIFDNLIRDIKEGHEFKIDLWLDEAEEAFMTQESIAKDPKKLEQYREHFRSCATFIMNSNQITINKTKDSIFKILTTLPRAMEEYNKKSNKEERPDSSVGRAND